MTSRALPLFLKIAPEHDDQQLFSDYGERLHGYTLHNVSG